MRINNRAKTRCGKRAEVKRSTNQKCERQRECENIRRMYFGIERTSAVRTAPYDSNGSCNSMSESRRRVCRTFRMCVCACARVCVRSMARILCIFGSAFECKVPFHSSIKRLICSHSVRDSEQSKANLSRRKINHFTCTLSLSLSRISSLCGRTRCNAYRGRRCCCPVRNCYINGGMWV